MQARDLAIRDALIAAYQADRANRSIFAGDLSSLETAQYGHQLQPELKVHVRTAAECLLRMPKLSDLVPASLSAFLTKPRPLAEANDEIIVAALRQVYSEGDAPNVKHAYERATVVLNEEGYRATKARIQTIAERPEFANKRGRPGVRKTLQTSKK